MGSKSGSVACFARQYRLVHERHLLPSLVSGPLQSGLLIPVAQSRSHCWAAWLMMAIQRLAASSVSADSCTLVPSSVSMAKLCGRVIGSSGMRSIVWFVSMIAPIG
uniref:Uncharacterized protein n=1 Tax=Anopheles coluzzii TaxID=1518534 RepID=A0A8W7PE27_ANOCL